MKYLLGEVGDCTVLSKEFPRPVPKFVLSFMLFVGLICPNFRKLFLKELIMLFFFVFLFICVQLGPVISIENESSPHAASSLCPSVSQLTLSDILSVKACNPYGYHREKMWSAEKKNLKIIQIL